MHEERMKRCLHSVIARNSLRRTRTQSRETKIRSIEFGESLDPMVGPLCQNTCLSS